MRIQFFSAIILVGVLAACAGAPKTAEEKKSLSASVATSIELVKKTDPTIEKFFKDNYAYAVLPSVGKGGFIIGGAGGDGEEVRRDRRSRRDAGAPPLRHQSRTSTSPLRRRAHAWSS